MKIALLEPLSVSDELIQQLGDDIKKRGHEFVYYDNKTTDDSELIKRSKGCDIVMIANNKYSADVIKNTDKLKMISVAFTGVDHIDAEAVKAKDITVCNCAGYSNQSVAELVLGMAVIGMRNMRYADINVRNGLTSAGISGREICGKTVGIIGLGQIGMMVAKLFLAFGAKVIAYNRSQNEQAVKMGIEYKELDEVLKSSDIVSLNLPLNNFTRNFISKDKIALMGKNTVFINCARGPIVDNNALADALDNDELGFACIDVYDMEPPIPQDYRLLNAKNTFLTPHQAFISQEAMIRRAHIVFNNVYSYLDGKTINKVNL